MQSVFTTTFTLHRRVAIRAVSHTAQQLLSGAAQPPSRLIRTLGSRLSASSVPPPAFPESKHRLVSRGSTVSVWPRAHLPKASHAFLFTQEG